MEEPSELTEGTLLELRRIVEDYPYFQVARMLYLKNLAVLNDMSFTSELERMAIFLPDRNPSGPADNDRKRILFEAFRKNERL